MKILFVTPYVPNQIRVRPYELLKALATRGHEITLATLWQSAEEREDIAALEAMGIKVAAEPLPKLRSLWNSASALPTRIPLQARYCWQPTLAKVLERLVTTESFDVAHVEHLRGAAYGLHLRKIGSSSGRALPIVWDSVDCISYLFAQAAEQSRSLSSRMMTSLELPRTRHYEGWLLQQFDRVLVTSTIDRQALRDLAGQQLSVCEKTGCSNRARMLDGIRRSHKGVPVACHDTSYRDNFSCDNPDCDNPIVLPNGVDLSYFTHRTATRDHEQMADVDRQGTAPTVVFSGKMSYHANVTAALYLAHEIMPHVWAHYPQTRLQIVGKDPPAKIRALATSSSRETGGISAGQAQQSLVEVTGTVPDLPPYLQQATVAAAPLLYGAGIQNKVLEAMACGAPVVTTEQAAGGMQAQPGQDLVVASDTAAFAAAIVRLLDHPAERIALGDAGRAYVERHHSWLAVIDQLETIYEDAKGCNLAWRL